MTGQCSHFAGNVYTPQTAHRGPSTPYPRPLFCDDVPCRYRNRGVGIRRPCLLLCSAGDDPYEVAIGGIELPPSVPRPVVTFVPLLEFDIVPHDIISEVCATAWGVALSASGEWGVPTKAVCVGVFVERWSYAAAVPARRCRHRLHQSPQLRSTSTMGAAQPSGATGSPGSDSGVRRRRVRASCVCFGDGLSAAAVAFAVTTATLPVTAAPCAIAESLRRCWNKSAFDR